VVTAAINNITLLSSTNIEIGTTGFNGSISIWGYYRNRVLTPSEALWISKEPYAMLRPTIRTRYFIPSAVAGTTPLSYSFSDNLNDEVIA
jgi:hypothetical protein